MRGVARIPEPREWMLERRCASCGETKPWAAFSPERRWPDGTIRAVRSYCKRCDAERMIQATESNTYPTRSRATRSEYQRRWRRRRGTREARLPVGPFRELLLASLPRFGTWREFGAVVDVNESVLRRAAKDTATVSLDVVDRCTTRLGVHLSELYPDQCAR